MKQIFRPLPSELPIGAVIFDLKPPNRIAAKIERAGGPRVVFERNNFHIVCGLSKVCRPAQQKCLLANRYRWRLGGGQPFTFRYYDAPRVTMPKYRIRLMAWLARHIRVTRN
jgi:hypothetical protein